MILVVDIGNTQVKWATTEGDGWVVQGQCPLKAIDRLALYWSDLSAPTKIVISNVAGSKVASAVDSAMSFWSVLPYWVEANKEQCGVKNSYLIPHHLGSDRWAAVIGAKSLNLGNVVAVCAGTATTIHGLTSEGVFLGGLIIPGYDLAHRSLSSSTAKLTEAEGSFSRFPVSTRDAITSGVIRATCKTVESFCDDMEAEGYGNVQIVLSGGAAFKLKNAFVRPIINREDLIFLGLLKIALSL